MRDARGSDFVTSRPAAIRRTAVRLVCLLAAAVSLPALGGAELSFTKMTPGATISNQFQGIGITFVPYADRVTGTVAPTPTGTVALFNACPGCTQYVSAARAVFTSPQRVVRVDVGVLDAQRATPVFLTGFDSRGAKVAAARASVTPGRGSYTTLEITSSDVNIVSFTVRAGGVLSNRPPLLTMRGVAFSVVGAGAPTPTPRVAPAPVRPPPPPPPYHLAISAAEAKVDSAGRIDITATVENTGPGPAPKTEIQVVVGPPLNKEQRGQIVGIAKGQSLVTGPFTFQAQPGTYTYTVRAGDGAHRTGPYEGKIVVPKPPPPWGLVLGIFLAMVAAIAALIGLRVLLARGGEKEQVTKDEPAPGLETSNQEYPR